MSGIDHNGINSRFNQSFNSLKFFRTYATGSGHTQADPQPCCGAHGSASSSGTNVAINSAKPWL